VDTFWKQRTKKHWILDGDQNTKFFHIVANNRRKFNTIHSICVDGVSFDDNSSVKEAIVNFYKKLYEEDPPNRPFL